MSVWIHLKQPRHPAPRPVKEASSDIVCIARKLTASRSQSQPSHTANAKKKAALRGLFAVGRSTDVVGYATSTEIFFGFTASAFGRISSSTPSL